MPTYSTDDVEDALAAHHGKIFVDYDNLPDRVNPDSVLPEESDVIFEDAEHEFDLTPIIRPNSEAYHPRKINAKLGTDIEFIRKIHDNRMPALLYGLPGTGKSALLEAALPGLVTIMGTSDTETADFIGSWIQNPDGSYEWIDGPLVKAMEAGAPLLIDEISLIDPRTMSLIYSVMDGRDRLPITANPRREDVISADGFVVFGACNPDAPGSIMSDALLSRFQIHIHMTTDWDLMKRLGIPHQITTIARKLGDRYLAGDIVSPPQVRELITFRDCAENFSVDVAFRNFLGQARPEDREVFAEVMRADAGNVEGLSI